MHKVVVLSSINVIFLPILINYVNGKPSHLYGNSGLVGLTFDYHGSSIVNVIKGLFNITLILKVSALNIKFLRHRLVKYKSKIKKTDPKSAKAKK